LEAALKKRDIISFLFTVMINIIYVLNEEKACPGYINPQKWMTSPVCLVLHHKKIRK
jgi:hypothetical protein